MGLKILQRHYTAAEWLLIAVSGLIIYILLLTLYRLTLHPLSHIPGPLLSKITSWSIVSQARSGSRHLTSLHEHHKYGPVVRIGPNALSFDTAAALEDIYGSRKANVVKSDWYRTIDAGSGAFSTHSEIDRQRHAVRRRILGQAFSDAALRSAEVRVLENVDVWCEYLVRGEDGEEKGNGEWSVSRNMADWASYLSYDIMGDLTFGKRFECIERDEHRYVPGLMMRATAYTYVLGHLPFIALIRPLIGTWIMNLAMGSLARDSAAYIDYANRNMDARIAAGSPPSSSEPNTKTSPSRKDLMSYLLSARDESTNHTFTQADLHAEASLLMHAGSDTTAVTLSACLFYLLHNPATLDNLTREIRTAFPSSAESIVSGPKLIACTYLRACIDETLRLAPAVPGHLPREVLTGGMVIDGHFVPAGTVVGVCTWAIHHNEMYFPGPYEFRPERWLLSEEKGKGNEEEVARVKAAFCAFSLGTRGCVGKNLAYLEVSLALARLLWRFDLRVGEGVSGGGGGGAVVGGREERSREDEYQIYDHFTAGRDGPSVCFRRR